MDGNIDKKTLQPLEKLILRQAFFIEKFIYSIILLPIMLLHCIIPKINTKNSFNKNIK